MRVSQSQEDTETQNMFTQICSGQLFDAKGPTYKPLSS